MPLSEKTTDLNIQQLIDKLPAGITSVERVILCSDGTVQTLLSVLFGVYVKVEVLSQKELPGIGILRWTKLVAQFDKDNEIVACLAESIIPFKNPDVFITDLNEQKMGIGQILKSRGFKQERQVFGIYADDNVIARNYRIFGDVEIIITETFPREAIKKADRMIEKNYDIVGIGKTFGT